MFPGISHEKIFPWDGCDHYYTGRKFTETSKTVNRIGSIWAVREVSEITARFDIWHVLV